MKKVFVLVLFAVFGTYVVKAQDDSQMEKEKTEVKDDGTVKVKDEEVTAKNNEHKSYEDRTKAGQTVDNVGHGTVQGIRGAGKGVGNAASWTWDNTKHNKVTKKIFDQPENAEERQLKMQKKAEKKEVKKQRKEGVAQAKSSESDDNTGQEMKQDVENAADETGDAASAAWNDTKHNKATREVFDQPGDVDQHDKDKKDKDKGGKSKETETKTKDKGDKEVTKEKKTKTDKDGNTSVKKEKETSY